VQALHFALTQVYNNRGGRAKMPIFNPSHPQGTSSSKLEKSSTATATAILQA